jgi:hypothetical protein
MQTTAISITPVDDPELTIVDNVPFVEDIGDEDIASLEALPPDTKVEFLAAFSPDEFSAEAATDYGADSRTVAAYEAVKADYAKWLAGEED